MVKFTIFTVRLSEDTVKMLKARSIQTNEPMSSMVRRLIVQGVSQETAGENTDVLAAIGREITKESDRLAKLIIRTMKAAAAGMYLAAEAAGGTEAPKRLDDALGMAVKYIKLPDAEMTGKADLEAAGDAKPGPEPGWESCGISDEELFDL